MHTWIWIGAWPAGAEGGGGRSGRGGPWKGREAGAPGEPSEIDDGRGGGKPGKTTSEIGLRWMGVSTRMCISFYYTILSNILNQILYVIFSQI